MLLNFYFKIREKAIAIGITKISGSRKRKIKDEGTLLFLLFLSYIVLYISFIFYKCIDSILINVKILDAILQEALKHLQESVNIIDKDYTHKWTTTAVDEKIRFFPNLTLTRFSRRFQC